MASLRTLWTPLACVACVALAGCGITIPGNLDLDLDPSLTGAAGSGGSRPPWGGTAGNIAGTWSGGASGTSPGTAGVSPGVAGSWGGYAGTGVAGSWGGSAGAGVAGWWGGGGYAGTGVAGWGGYAGGVAPTYPADHDNDGWNEYSDCDDYNWLVHPGAMDACCDFIDSDCDGSDAPVGAACKCAPPQPERDWDGDGYAQSQGDCDDSNWQVHPGQFEICDDGIDNDCNGWVDYNDRCTPADSDGDGYPDVSDCDPWNANVNQGMGEICGDGIDNNCDGIVDGYPWCNTQPSVDWDRDGFPYEKDCNDADNLVFPGSPYEQCCDGIDSNCDGLDAPYNAICTCPTPGDRDGDGYGIGMSDPTLADCNDQDATIHPNAFEDCGDKRDNDCDGFIDSADPSCQVIID